MTAGEPPAVPPAGRRRVPALGGERTVPEPDPIAREYLLLALRLDQADPGSLDAYYGPADLKSRVDLEARRRPDRLRDDAAALRARLGEVAPTDRRGWLEAQLAALETWAAELAGASIPYLELAERLYAVRPTRRDEATFDAAAAELDRLLPTGGPLVDRLADWDARFVVDVAGLPTLAAWLTGGLRARARARFGVPDGDAVRVGLVHGQAWAGYCWYDGGRTSRVDLNVDLPVRLPALIETLAHETYAGHHLEHAWKETELVERAGWLEASALSLVAPECVVSEGLASHGPGRLLPPDERRELLAESLLRAGLAGGAAEADELAATSVDLASPRARLDEIRVNAALLRHVDDASSAATLDYLRETGRLPEDRARQRLAFIEHPRTRVYGLVYDEGRELVRRWVEAAREPDRDARFGRLLREPLTPARLRRDADGTDEATDENDGPAG